MKTKVNINIVLPIALSLMLPGIGFLMLPNVNAFFRSGGLLVENFGIFGPWLLSSVYLYTLWYLMWFTWRLVEAYRLWWYVFIPVAFIGISFTVAYFLVFQFLEGFRWYSTLRMVPPVSLFIAIQYALRAQQDVARLQLEKEQIQTENYRVQLAALQAKVDPHFLFNSLNTLRSMVRQQHANSEKFIISLSDFFRYTLKHSEESSLRLSDELAVLEAYLFVMQSRHGAAVDVQLHIDPELHQFQLPTLALQIVVENCFKHNSMSSKRPLHIEISSTEDYYIAVRNNVQPKMGEQEPSGFGLDLLRKRYALLKVERGVVVEQSDTQFRVKLKLF